MEPADALQIHFRLYGALKALALAEAAKVSLAPAALAQAALRALLEGAPITSPSTEVGIEQALTNLYQTRVGLMLLANDLRARRQELSPASLFVLIERVREDIARDCVNLAAHLEAMRARYRRIAA